MTFSQTAVASALLRHSGGTTQSKLHFRFVLLPVLGVDKYHRCCCWLLVGRAHIYLHKRGRNIFRQEEAVTTCRNNFKEKTTHRDIQHPILDPVVVQCVRLLFMVTPSTQAISGSRGSKQAEGFGMRKQTRSADERDEQPIYDKIPVVLRTITTRRGQASLPLVAPIPALDSPHFRVKVIAIEVVLPKDRAGCHAETVTSHQ